MTEKLKVPPPGEAKEASTPLVLEPLELVNWEIPPELRKKLYEEIIPQLGLAEMDDEAGDLASDLGKITSVSRVILGGKKEETSKMRNSSKILVEHFNRSLEHALSRFNKKFADSREKNRKEISEISE